MTELETYFKKSTEDFLNDKTGDNPDVKVHAELLIPCDKTDKHRAFVSTTHHEAIITSLSICELHSKRSALTYLKPNSGLDGWSLVAKHLKPATPINH